MKKLFRSVAALLCAAVCVAVPAACGEGKGECELLGEPAATRPLSYTERQKEGYLALRGGAEAFAARFASSAYSSLGAEDNFAVSPVSVYMALSLAAACAEGETQSEILSALGVDYTLLQSEFSNYYRSVIAEEKDSDGKLSAMISLGNSIWLDTQTEAKQECISLLANNFHCYSYSANFQANNHAANLAVQNFVKEQTKGLIDKDFSLGKETVFALINTLYLKDIWNEHGDDLGFTSDSYGFENSDGSVKTQKLLSGYYSLGRAYETETYSSFFAETHLGCRLKFILPKEGYTVGEAFTAESIAEANSVESYNPVDTENRVRYHTRCLFPEYKAKFDKDVKGVLKSEFGIDKLFSADECKLTAVTERPAYCSRVQHVTDLTVDKKGIEGAAATVMVSDATSEPYQPEDWEDVYLDFVVDKAFGFIITDPYGATLFSGIVNGI